MTESSNTGKSGNRTEATVSSSSAGSSYGVSFEHISAKSACQRVSAVTSG